jgi:hypothetical protein
VVERDQTCTAPQRVATLARGIALRLPTLSSPGSRILTGLKASGRFRKRDREDAGAIRNALNPAQEPVLYRGRL